MSKATNTIFKQPVLLVTLPQESADTNDEKSSSLQAIQEKIGIMEAIYSNIAGLGNSVKFTSMFSGAKNHIAFEIVVKKGAISFYIAPPEKLKQFIVQQIQAQYPDAHIEEVEDYNIFSPQGFIDGVYLGLSKNSLFPIKTYKSLQSDPLNSIINALSKMESDDGAAIQFVVRPTISNWRAYGTKIAGEVRKGKSLKEAVSSKGSLGSEIMSGIGGDLNTAIFGGNEPKNEKPQEIYKPSAMEEESVKAIEEKISKAGLETNIRIIVSADKKDQVEMYMENILNSFGQYNIYQYGNSFKVNKPLRQKSIVNDFIYRNFDPSKKMIFNSEEMASLFHFPLPSTQTPNIKWLSSKEAPAPQNILTDGIVLGENIYRDKQTMIKIGREDRTRHVYAIGKSGTGKSEMLSNMAKQDIRNGDGVAVIDPHGDLVDDILETIPNDRAEDVIYFDPSNMDRPMGLNLLEYDKKYPEQKTFVINEMIRIFDKLYDLKQTGGPMFEQYVRNAMLLIMEDTESGSTLMEISKVLADADFRKYKLSKCANPVVKDFWQKEAEKAGGEAALANMVPYITSKLNTFVSNDIMRPIIGQQESAFNLREVMDSRKILLVNLSKGKIGESNAFLLGLVLVGKILMAALSRTDAPRNERKDFYLYLDEFQNFITDSISVILSEARKYRLNLNIAHQYIGQLVKNQDTSIRDAIFGNVGTIMSFKVGADDAEFLAKEFAPIFSAHDLVNIDKFNAYIKLIIDNQPSRAFNMHAFPLDKSGGGNPEKIKQLSALKYGRDRSVVEAEILKRMSVID
ncbi:type IV secretion system DNA-binding domain-containing protein [Candidatus Falkowbacteria bacterium]|jgi:hypothetical protein|nr:type IV secretion system DNA-binding domain-containing protein [Candidatus Falkowbacteria bacterium]MBT4432904.1 type IV secretion system DNA-binding domain-containing protein [Candidatus Falkowbacteria bacterium]